MSVSDIRIELELNDKNFTIKTKKAGKAIRSLEKDFDRTDKSLRKIEKSVGGFLPKLRDLAITASIVKGGITNLVQGMFGWQKALIGTNAEIERMTFLLKGMSDATTEEGRVRDAADDIAYLFDQAERAPFSLGEMTNSLVKMRSVGIDDARGSMQSLTDAVAQFGGTDETLHRATIAIQQMAGKGVISMEELRQQLGEAVPTAIKLMARSMNLTYQELVDAISTGRVEANDALNRMFAEMDRTMGGAGQRMMDTWSGMISRLETRWMRFQVMLGESGYFEEAKEALQKMIDGLDPNKVEVFAQQWGQLLGEAVQTLTKITEFLIEHGAKIVETAKYLVQLWAAYKVIGGVAALWKNGAKALGAYNMAKAAAAVEAKKAKTSYLDMGKSSSKAAANVGKLSRAVGILGAGLRALGGPWGFVISIAASAGLAMIDFSSDVEEATEMVEKQTLALSENSKETLRNAIEKKRALAEEANQEYIKGQQMLAGAEGNPMGDRWRGRARKKMADAEAELVKLNAELAALEELQYESRQKEFQNHADHQLELQERLLAKQQANYSSAYDKEMSDLADAQEAGAVTEEEYLDRKVEILENYYANAQKVLADRGVDLVKELENANSDKERFAIRAEMEEVSKLSKELTEEGEREIKNARRAAKLLDQAGKGQGRLANRFDQTSANIKKLQADLADGSTSLAKFKSLIEDGFYGEEGETLLKGGEINGKTLDDMYEMLRLQDELTQKIKDKKEAERAQENLNQMYREGNSELATARNLFNTGIDNNFIDGINQEVEELLRKMPEAEQDILDVADAVKKNATLEEGFGNLSKMIDETRKINTSLLKEEDRFAAEYAKKKEDAGEMLIGLEYMTIEERKAAYEAYYAYLDALEDQYNRQTQSKMETMLEGWQDVTGRMKDASADWLNDATDRLTDFIVTGKGGFNDLVESILKDIIKLRIQGQISDALGGSGGFISDLLGGFFGGGGAAAPAGGGSIHTTAGAAGSGGFDWGSLWPFADGGIMTNKGSLPLNMYANGGIANSPQLALYGEGRMPEAYVPLPDGRTIPVTIAGGMPGGQTPDVQVNVINQTSQEVNANQGQMRFDGKQFVLDVVMQAASTPGPFRSSMKGALK